MNTATKITNALKNRTRVEDSLTLAELYRLVGGDLEAFKAECVRLYEVGQIKLDDYTRAWADIWDRPEKIEYNLNWSRGYGLKWYVRGT